jgi:putative membrane protein
MPEISKMILRDYLAADRTKMANERTLLAYLRTALVIFATAVTLIKLFPEDNALLIVGIIFIPFSVAIFIFGVHSYWKEIKKIKEYYNGDYQKDLD